MQTEHLADSCGAVAASGMGQHDAMVAVGWLGGYATAAAPWTLLGGSVPRAFALWRSLWALGLRPSPARLFKPKR